MKRFKCPSCGAPYNGKRCRNCRYEHFVEEIGHGNHVHRGEPLVIESPVRRPVPQKNPFGCDKKTRKKHPLIRFLVLLSLIYSLLPLFRNWGLLLEATETRNRTATRETVVPAADAVTLYRTDYLHIFTTEQEAERFAEGLTLYVQNDLQRDLEIRSVLLQVNGRELREQELYCRAGANAIGKMWLKPDREQLKNTGVEEVLSLSFMLEVCDPGGGVLHTTDLITLE